MVTIGLTKAHCGQCPAACAGRDEAPGQGRGTGFLQETAFDLDLGEWVKHAQVKMGDRGDILESEVWFPGVPTGKGFSWVIKDLWVGRATRSLEGAPRKPDLCLGPEPIPSYSSWVPGAG